MLVALLALGLWPLLTIAAVSIAIIYCLEEEAGGGATLALLVGAGIVAWTTHTNPLPWLQHNAGLVVGSVAGYFAVGVLWAFVKWYFFLLNVRDDVVAHPDKYQYATFPPKVSDSRGRITTWMTYWPWSATWTLINDPIKRIWRAIYRLVAGKLQSISNRVFRDVERIR